ncbi:hypothetical protein WG66_011605 [Moniliophthora roreri]|nr:hypothetical protein WG66_011605 [Moniliophthora roreri]
MFKGYTQRAEKSGMEMQEVPCSFVSSSTPAAVILEPHNYPLPAPMLCQASGPSHQCPETPVKISRTLPTSALPVSPFQPLNS